MVLDYLCGPKRICKRDEPSQRRIHDDRRIRDGVMAVETEERDRETETEKDSDWRKRVIARCKTARFEDGGRAQEPSSTGKLLKLRWAG